MASTNIKQILARCVTHTTVSEEYDYLLTIAIRCRDNWSDEAEVQDVTRISWVCFHY